MTEPIATSKKITILLADAPGKARVLASVFGEWAYHGSFERAGWQVTFVPSGRCLAGLADHFSLNEARAIAYRLGSEGIDAPPLTVPGKPEELTDERFIIEAVVAEVLTLWP